MSQVSVRAAHRNFGPVTALDGADLDVEEGQLLAVLGPSGCGKTTLLRAIAGIETLDSGAIHIGDRTVDDGGKRVPPERRSVGLVPQEGALFPHLNVTQNIAFGLRGKSKAEQKKRVGELLDLVGLSDYARRQPHELSGGQQQRIALARALAPEPTVILLDEPFSALDAGLRATLRDDVRELLREVTATAILVTHDQTEALSMADAIAVMRDGQMTQQGSPAEVYRQPLDRWTAKFMGDAVMIPGTQAGNCVRCALGELPLARSSASNGVPERTVFVRPEQIVRSEAGMEALVESLSFYGHDAAIHLRLTDGTLVSCRWPSNDLPQTGDRIQVSVVGQAMAYDIER